MKIMKVHTSCLVIALYILCPILEYSYHFNSVTTHFLALGRVCFNLEDLLFHSLTQRTPDAFKTGRELPVFDRFAFCRNIIPFSVLHTFIRSATLNKGLPLGTHTYYIKRSYSCLICSFHYYYDCKLNFGGNNFSMSPCCHL